MVLEEGSHPADDEVIFSYDDLGPEPTEHVIDANRITVSKSLTVDTNPYYSDTEDNVIHRRPKRFTKRTRSSHKVDREVTVSFVTEFCGEVTVKEDSPLHVMCVNPERPGPGNRSHQFRTVLCDTGATSSIVSLKLAKEIGIQYQKDDSITVCGADGNVIATEGVGTVYLRDPVSTSFRKVRTIITREG